MVRLNPIDEARYHQLLNSLSNFGRRRVERIVREEEDRFIVEARRDAPVATGELRDSIRRDEQGQIIVEAAHGAINEFGGRNHPRTPFFLQNAREASTRITERIRDELRRL